MCHTGVMGSVIMQMGLHLSSSKYVLNIFCHHVWLKWPSHKKYLVLTTFKHNKLLIIKLCFKINFLTFVVF